MSESTTKATKTKKPSTGTESKSTKSESKSTSSTESKSTSSTESKSTSSTESKSTSGDSTSTKSDSTPAEKSTKGRAAADLSPSYFSSVSTPEYRSGWDSVFSSGGAKKQTAKPRRAKGGLPVTIELDHADLDDGMRALIEDAFRRKAKKQRVKFDRHMQKARMTWRLECQFTD